MYVWFLPTNNVAKATRSLPIWTKSPSLGSGLVLSSYLLCIPPLSDAAPPLAVFFFGVALRLSKALASQGPTVLLSMATDTKARNTNKFAVVTRRGHTHKGSNPGTEHRDHKEPMTPLRRWRSDEQSQLSPGRHRLSVRVPGPISKMGPGCLWGKMVPKCTDARRN